MANFHHHPDGLIFVRGENETYSDTVENFAADFGHSLPDLPVGITERFYEPGVRHFLSNGIDSFPLDELSWDYGDLALLSLPTLLAAQQARQ